MRYQLQSSILPSIFSINKFSFIALRFYIYYNCQIDVLKNLGSRIYLSRKWVSIVNDTFQMYKHKSEIFNYHLLIPEEETIITTSPVEETSIETGTTEAVTEKPTITTEAETTTTEPTTAEPTTTEPTTTTTSTTTTEATTTTPLEPTTPTIVLTGVIKIVVHI